MRDRTHRSRGPRIPGSSLRAGLPSCSTRFHVNLSRWYAAQRMRGVLLSFLALVSCVAPDPNLEGRRCPCLEDWVCIADRCVRGVDATPPDGSFDSSVDAGVDADAMDADVPDAMRDARLEDAPSEAGDAAPVDASIPTGCGEYEGVIVCDGFESFHTDDGLWRRDERGANTLESTLQASRGERSVRVRVVEPTSSAVLIATFFPPRDEGALWLRFDARLVSEASPLALVFLTEGVGDGDGLAIELRGDGTMGVVSSVDGTSLDGPPLSSDTWACFELHVEIGEVGSLALYRNGALVAQETAIRTLPGEGFGYSRLNFGAASVPVDTESVEWLFDEVVLSDTRNPCSD